MCDNKPFYFIRVIDNPAIAAGDIALLGPAFPGAGVFTLVAGWLRLCAMWDWTRCPAARAEQRESSPASTAEATILASCLALSPGLVR